RNPATGIKNIWNGSRKNNIWTPTQIEILRQKAPEPIIRAMLLAFYTGQRQGDLLRLKWSDYDGIYIRIKQSKGGKRVKVKVHTNLKICLDNLDKTSIRILTNTRGKPWTQSGFKSSWRKACKAAGIEGVTFHDLRGTFITERAKEGSTAPQIASISGHSLNEVNRTLENHYLAEDQQTSDAVILRMEK
ncbi:MAG: tyrosine-type recombinase/integrase, partial [Desulfobacteraceae bacterium]|nr:tyrosine-type recombinase/integrase [Desulfobacteraceae bacterium]